MSNISAGPVSMKCSVHGYYLPLSAERRRTNPTTKITKLTKDAQSLFAGTFDPLPYPKRVHDYLLAAAGPPVGCLGESELPYLAGPRFGGPLGLGGSPVRSCAGPRGR
ncbi:MAG: hypothetical protein WCP70_08085 [Methanothrix sp.]